MSTTVSLALTSGSGPVSTVSSGTVVTFTATVTSGSGAVYPGQLDFCETSGSTCTDIHLLGTAQLTSSGSATLKLRPGLGSHSYKAVFLGTQTTAGSASSTAALTVTGTPGPFASTTTIAETGGWGTYNLTATLTGFGGTVAPTGSVSFVDTSNASAVLATQPLGPATPGIAWPNPMSINLSYDTRYVVVTDLNGDGIPDLVVNENPVAIYLGNAAGTYTEAPLPSTGGTPAGPMISADFNGDGIPDLAVALYASSNVSLLLGHGDGTFAPAIEAALPSAATNVSQLVSADFNRDGIPDLAVVDNYSNVLAILLGKGDGTFAAPITPSVSGSPSGVAVGDFNGDGKTDLAVEYSYSDSVTIFLSNGDGTFATAGTARSGVLNSQIAAADLNGDGKLDLAVAAGGNAGTGESITVLTGNGDGTLNAPSSPQNPASSSVTWLGIADFNQDGAADVVVADSSGNATVFLNEGKGSFGEGLPVLTGLSVPAYLMVGVGDLNGDGYPDVVGGAYYGNSLWLNLTEPTETATVNASVSLPATGQHSVDASYSGDSNYIPSISGTLPLWGTPPATTTTLTMTSGGNPVSSVGPGTAITLTATVKAGTTPVTSGQVNFCDASATHCTDIHLLATAQLSSNGVATFTFIPGAGQDSYKAIFVEDGFGASSTSNVASLTVGPAPAAVYTDAASIAASGTAGDYTLTGTVVGFGGTAVPTGTVSFVDTSFGNTVLGTASLGAGTAGLGFRVSQTPAVGGTVAAEVAGDFNGDGKPDVALLWTNSLTGGYSVTILFGNGDGTFTAGPNTSATGVQPNPVMIPADLNGDGKTDLAILSANVASASYLTSMLGNGDGTFAAPQTTVAYSPGPVGGDFIPGSLVAADFNGDGKIDVAVVGDYVSSGGVTILLGNGDGTFTTVATNFALSQGFNVVATGDFNGDGIPDLVASNYFGPGTSTVLLGKGDGTFTIGATLGTGPFVNSIVVGDFDGDGKLDLAFSYNVSGIDICLGGGDGTFVQAPGGPLTATVKSLVASDFNHDGKLDLAGIDTYSGQVDLFLGAGDATFAETITTPRLSQIAAAPIAIVAADLDGDGIPDLAMSSRNIDSAAILLTEPTETATATVTGIAPIGAVTHNVELDYAGDGNYSATSSSTVPLAAGLAPLVITPASGTYSTVQSVTISESIPGATIYYLEQGTVSTNGFVPYTAPIPLNYGGSESIMAYATETGYAPSQTAQLTYTLAFPQDPAPSFSPGPGYYSGAQIVTISDSDPSAQLYYTTNGEDPDLNSTQYTGPIAVASSETLVARAISAGRSLSPLVTGQYVIGSSSVPMVYSIAGSGMAGYTGDGGPATLAQTGYAASIVQDSSGNIYFSDEGNHMVRKIAAGTGVISVLAGNGYNGYTGDGGAAISAELGFPASLALDSAGNLYVADSGNFTIRKVNLSTGIISTYAGDPTATSPGDGGPATSAELGFIAGLAVDASNNLYISGETLETIRVVNAATGVISTIAGTGAAGYGGDGGPAINAEFRSPQGLAFDASGDLYIADFQNSLIRKMTATNGLISTSSIITTVAGVVPSTNGQANAGYTGDGGPATAAELNRPEGVAVDTAGNLFITDYYNGVVREVTASNGNIQTFAGNGVLCGTLSGDAGPVTSASFCYPGGIFIDPSGNVFVGDGNYRIREIVTTGAPPSQQAAIPTFSVPAGNYANPQSVTIADTTVGASIYVTVDGSTPETGSSPGYSLPVNVAGTVTLKAIAAAPGYLASPAATVTYNIGAFAPLITTVAGNGTTTFNAAGGPASSLGLASPTGLAIDSAGNLYVSDQARSVVWKISASTGMASLYAGSGIGGYSGDGGPAVDAELRFPEGLAIDSAGNLYIADYSNNVVREVAAKTGIISTVVGQGPSSYGGIGDGGPATSANLSGPAAVAFDGSGNLYIADSQHYRIRKVSAATGIITTVAGDGSFVQSGDGGPATSAGLQMPNELAVDHTGNIYIGTSNGSRVREVTVATGIIQTIAGLKDLPGDTGDGGPATSAEVMLRSLAVDAAGNLYISSSGEIREIDISTGVISRVAGIGYPGYSGDGGAATVAQVFYPAQVAFDAEGNLYFAASSGRIRKVTLAAHAVATPVISPAAGTYITAQNVSITDAASGATIYYTIDGSTPSNSSNVYTVPITISSSATIKAIAMEVGYYASGVASAAYVINLAAPPPTLTRLSPAYTSAAGSQFTLTVNGSNFTSDSTVYWGSSALATTLVSSTQVTATVPASDIASPGYVSITAQLPSTSTSNTLQFEIDTAGSVPPAFSNTSLTVTAGGSATSRVTLPSSATNVSAKCLNLPAGASCSYSPGNGTLTLTTSSSTPKGTYVVTVVFTETLPGTAVALLLFPFLLTPFRRERLNREKVIRLLAIAVAVAALAFACGCGGGGAGGSSTPPPQTQQVTSSATVTLTVQ